MITYEENGFPVELTSERDIARAVRQNRIRADTIVREHRPDGTIVTARAGDLPALRSLLHPAREDMAAAPQPPTSPASLVMPESRAPTHRITSPEVRRFPAPEAPSAHAMPVFPDVESDKTPRPPAAKDGGNGCIWWAIAAVLLAAVAMWFANSQPRTADTATPAPVAEEPEKKPTDVVGGEVDYWASRAVTVRRAPDPAAEAFGELRRGDAIRGTVVRGPAGGNDWVRISAGQFAGAYVWINNLADAARPPLEVVFDNEARQIVIARPAYAAPDFSAVEGETFAIGSTVQVAGRTQGGWWEIALKGGGVGYLPSDAIAAACAGPDCRTVTSNGWGGIEAGMTLAAAEAASGFVFETAGHYDGVVDPDEDGTIACNVHGLTNGPGDIGVFVENGIVTSIVVSGNGNANFRTDRGIGIGDSEAALRAAYPSLEEKPDIYSEPPDKKLFFRDRNGMGIKFSINSGVVSSIAAGGQSIEYVEGCL